MNYGFRKDSQNIAGCGHLRGTCGPLMKMPNWKLKKKTILDNWFPISQVTASTYQHNEKLPQTQSEQEPLWCIYLQKYLNFKAWNSSKKRKNIKSSTHPSTRRLTSLSRSALRYLGWKYRRSRDHNLGFSWTFRCFRTEVLHSKNAEAWGLQHQIFSLPMLISILYTLHLCLWFGCCNSLEVRAWGKGTGKAQTWGNLPKKKLVKSKKIGWHSTSTTTCQKNGQSLFTSNSIIRNHSPIPRTSGEDVVYNECVRSRELCQVITYLWKFGPTNFPSNHYRKFASYSGRVSQYYPLEMEFSRRPREYSPFFCFYLNVYMILHVL